MLGDFFKASGQEEDIQNWTVKVLGDGKWVPVLGFRVFRVLRVLRVFRVFRV